MLKLPYEYSCAKCVAFLRKKVHFFLKNEALRSKRVKKHFLDRDFSTLGKLKIEIQDVSDNIIPEHLENLARCIPTKKDI